MHGMTQDRWDAALTEGVRISLSDYERDAVAWIYQDGRPFIEIALGVGRSLGTVKTAVRALRAMGLVGRRYSGCSSV